MGQLYKSFDDDRITLVIPNRFFCEGARRIDELIPDYCPVDRSFDREFCLFASSTSYETEALKSTCHHRENSRSRCSFYQDFEGSGHLNEQPPADSSAAKH